MTKEEAKRRLEVWLKCMDCPEDKQCYDSHLHSTCEYTDYCDETPISEAVKVAIQALSQEPCDDAISRDAVCDYIAEFVNNEYSTQSECEMVDFMIEGIQHLPSVTQKPKTGHWIEHPEIETSTPEYLMFYECSECGNKQCFYKADTHRRNYCGECGAKMDEPQESESKE